MFLIPRIHANALSSIIYPPNGRCIKINVGDSCVERKTLHCINCHSHFMTVRPSIKAIVVSKHFVADLKNEEFMSRHISSASSFCSGLRLRRHQDTQKKGETVRGLLWWGRWDLNPGQLEISPEITPRKLPIFVYWSRIFN